MSEIGHSYSTGDSTRIYVEKDPFVNITLRFQDEDGDEKHKVYLNFIQAKDLKFLLDQFLQDFKQ